MKEIIIFCDSCSSVTPQMAEKLNISVIPTLFEMEGKEYNPISPDILSYDEYYEKLENKTYCKTSCINPNTFIELFKPHLEKGNDVLYIALSSGLSASCNNAKIAKMELDEMFDAKLEVIDTLTGSLGIMYAIEEAIKMKNEGKTVTEIKANLDNNSQKVVALFTIGSLDHLRRGGRLSTFSAVVGTLLHINPIITTNEKGQLVENGKYRGRKKAIANLIERINNNAIPNSKIYIAYTNALDEAEHVKEVISKDHEVEMGYIDHTLGAHCGPKTVAVFYMDKN